MIYGRYVLLQVRLILKSWEPSFGRMLDSNLLDTFRQSGNKPMQGLFVSGRLLDLMMRVIKRDGDEWKCSKCGCVIQRGEETQCDCTDPDGSERLQELYNIETNIN